MRLVDPLSKSLFSRSLWARLPWIATPASRFIVLKARKAARLEDWPKACASYTKALGLSPRDGPIWVQLGHGLGKLGYTEASRIAYHNATQVEPRLAAGHKHLGLVRYKTSLHDQGMDSLACALFLNPNDAELRRLMAEDEGEVKLESRLVAAALNLADRHSSPSYIGARATILRAKARAAARRRHWSEAEHLYKRLTRMRPHDAHGLLQLGHALNEQHKKEEAEIAFRRAAAAAPLLADAWLHLGYVLTARKQHLIAREAFAVVNRLAPGRRDEHPILEDAGLGAGSPNLSDGPFGKKLICPEGLGSREQFIWHSLVTHIESRF